MNTRISIDKITVVLKSIKTPDTLHIDVLRCEKFLANQYCGYEFFKVDKSNTVKPYTYVYHCELWDGENTKMILNFFRRDLSGKIMPWCEFTFNPNKHYDDFPKVLLMLQWLGFTRIREIPRVDIAVDVPVSPYEVEFACKRPIQIYQASATQITRYKRYADGCTMRIYNKAVEEGTEGNKTRCELVMRNWIAHNRDNYNMLWQHFGNVYFMDVEPLPILPLHITYALQNMPSCKLRDYIGLLHSRDRAEAQRYYDAKYKRYQFTLDDYDYICNLLSLYLPMLNDKDI